MGNKEEEGLRKAVYKKHYGRIPKGWVIHHLNECKDDNDPANLIAMPEALHNYMHSQQRRRRGRYSRRQIEALLADLEPELVAKSERLEAAYKRRADTVRLLDQEIKEIERQRSDIGKTWLDLLDPEEDPAFLAFARTFSPIR